MKFQERLRYLRERQGIKQEEMAKKLNISTSAYGYYEQGRNEPSLDSIKTIAEIFDVSADYLLGIIDTEKHPTTVADGLVLSDEDLQSIRLLRELQLLDDLNRSPDFQVERLGRAWQFIKHEIHIEKTQESE
ncbi:helix-turn-helix domain-containing protein [Gracilibacillus phocaeensis]|uniref:helix-turn-helix domain-containing protein n=1 Tax=Gracilibacillus phocaeensis TaxID=2042304 RepID=UPI0013EF1C80|nr:helix-turn-helix transcriptional regulator [Gracilibacillus phocaeensis]